MKTKQQRNVWKEWEQVVHNTFSNPKLIGNWNKEFVQLILRFSNEHNEEHDALKEMNQC